MKKLFAGEQNEIDSGSASEDDAQFGRENAPEISGAVSGVLSNLEKNGLVLTREWEGHGGVEDQALIRVTLTDKKGRIVLDLNPMALKEAELSS